MKYYPTAEFSTEYALLWAENYNDFCDANEELVYRNVRSSIRVAQREFETHLSEVMHYRSHQREF